MAGLVILTGFMGVGKTAVGRRLAERLGYGFVDTDAWIEGTEKRSVAEIFASEGEAYFREREREAVHRVARLEHTVVATGGGTIVDAENLRALSQAGTLICLRADVEAILARTAGEVRPLLKGDRAVRIRSLLAQRQAAYSRAPHALDTSGLSVEEAVDAIVEILRAQRATPTGG